MCTQKCLFLYFHRWPTWCSLDIWWVLWYKRNLHTDQTDRLCFFCRQCTFCLCRMNSPMFINLRCVSRPSRLVTGKSWRSKLGKPELIVLASDGSKLFQPIVCSCLCFESMRASISKVATAAGKSRRIKVRVGKPRCLRWTIKIIWFVIVYISEWKSKKVRVGESQVPCVEPSK